MYTKTTHIPLCIISTTEYYNYCDVCVRCLLLLLYHIDVSACLQLCLFHLSKVCEVDGVRKFIEPESSR